VLFIPCARRSVYSSAGSCSWKQTRGFEISSGSGVGRFRRFVVFVLRQRRATSGNLQRRGRRGVEGANLKTSKTVRRNAFFENRSKYPTPSATSHALFSSPMNVLKREKRFYYKNSKDISFIKTSRPVRVTTTRSAYIIAPSFGTRRGCSLRRHYRRGRDRRRLFPGVYTCTNTVSVKATGERTHPFRLRDEKTENGQGDAGAPPRGELGEAVACLRNKGNP